MPKQFQFLRWQGKRAVALLVLTLSLTSVVVLGTVAYIIDSTDMLTNIFTPAEISSEVIVSGTEISARNTGDVEAYIRATVVVTWVDSAGNVHAVAPVRNTHYTISYDTTGSWLQGNDGFWYYKNVVPAGTEAVSVTAPLVIGYDLVAGASIPEGATGLSVEVLTSAIQTEPTSTVSSIWNVTVNGDGTLKPN